MSLSHVRDEQEIDGTSDPSLDSEIRGCPSLAWIFPCAADNDSIINPETGVE